MQLLLKQGKFLNIIKNNNCNNKKKDYYEVTEEELKK